MKIFIMTDLEGVAGVLDSVNSCNPQGRYYDESRRLLTEEVNAAIRGFCRGGATEIVVQIGHRTDSIIPALLDPRASLVSGHSEPVWPWALDSSFDALAFVGRHAKAGTAFAHLAHTGNMRTVDQRVNGISIGEYGMLALCAAELGIPTIFASGDEALSLEAQKLTPGVVTVAGKRGLKDDDGSSAELDLETYRMSKTAAHHFPIAKVRQQIEEGAELAVRRLAAEPDSFHYPRIELPCYMVREYRHSPNTPKPEPFAKAGYADSFIDGCNNIIYNENLPDTPLEDVIM